MILKQLTKQSIVNRFSSIRSAIFWTILQPVFILAVYFVVFAYIFKARVPGLTTEQFVAYLAIGLWPWMAFSDTLLATVNAVVDRKDLIGKIKINPQIFIKVQIAQNYLVHGLGFLLILSVILLTGLVSLRWELLLLVIPWVVLLQLNWILGLFLAAMQVFVKDTKQVITSLIPVLFFSAPIIYGVQALPNSWLRWMELNPLFFLTDAMHQLAFFDGVIDWAHLIVLFAVLIVLSLFAARFFNKLAPRFDDYI